MWMIVVWRSMCSPVLAVLVFNYFDHVADGVGESDVVMVTAVVASPSWTWRPSENIFNLFCVLTNI